MTRWQPLPPIELPSPVLALAADETALWAGGIGGAARYSSGWQSLLSGLPLTSVTALASINGWLYAGGAGGIARSPDGGTHWEQTNSAHSASPVTAFAFSPGNPTLLLASTLAHGVLRSTDAGAHWSIATFGLETLECTALLWAQQDSAFVGTPSGLYISPNGGRAWRSCAGTEGAPIAALVALPDGTLLAGVELGGVLRSQDGGETWHRHSDLPPDITITTMLSTALGVLLASSEHGLLHSRDGAASWTCVENALTLSLATNGATDGATDGARVYAGTTAQILASADGRAWAETLPLPPLQDHARLLLIEGKPLVYGVHSTPVLYDNHAGWLELSSAPAPLHALAQAADAALLASGADGMFRSEDSGQSWLPTFSGAAGRATHITMLPNGTGYAAGGSHLLRTTNNGSTWEALPSPFGLLTLVALQVFAAPTGTLLGITYDPRLQVAQIWYSADGGARWSRGAQLTTPFAQASSLAEPPLFTLGGYAFLKGASPDWDQRRVGDGSGVRRITGSPSSLFALTTNGIYRSDDAAITWTVFETGIPVEQIIDLALADHTLTLLVAGGQVVSAPLEK